MKEAVAEANEFQLTEDVIVRVMTPGHSVAVMPDTGRLKDYLRIGVFLEHDVVNVKTLAGVLAAYDLTERWQTNINKFQP